MEIYNHHKIYNQNFFVYGHRGVPFLEKENTLKSFERAIELGFDGIELDIMSTKDGKIIEATVEKSNLEQIKEAENKSVRLPDDKKGMEAKSPIEQDPRLATEKTDKKGNQENHIKTEEK